MLTKKKLYYLLVVGRAVSECINAAICVHRHLWTQNAVLTNSVAASVTDPLAPKILKSSSQLWKKLPTLKITQIWQNMKINKRRENETWKLSQFSVIFLKFKICNTCDSYVVKDGIPTWTLRQGTSILFAGHLVQENHELEWSAESFQKLLRSVWRWVYF